MKRNVLSVMASVIIAGTLVGAQSSPSQDQPPAPQSPMPSAPAPAPAPSPAAAPAAPDASQDDADDMTLKGCLVQGSAPNQFVLENAKLATDAESAKGKSYAVEIQAPADQIKSIVNTHVQIVGKAEKSDSASPDDKDSKDSNMPKLTAKRITRIAATCPSSGD
jgi:hypothetical protein